MSGDFTERHYVLGIEGLALLRAGVARSADGVADRVAEIAATAAAAGDGPPRVLPTDDAAAGYAGWAASYDQPGNDLIALEEPAMLGLLADLPPGSVLDAACGTGRYAVHLAAAGRTVIGVDASDEMLDQARAKGLSDLRAGRLEALPLEDGEAGAALCALALSHLPDIRPAVAELARVVAPGGRIVISNPHPLATGLLGWRAVYVDAAATRRTIPEYAHSTADYIGAFTAAGLRVRGCLEPALDAAGARARAKEGVEDAFEQALTGLPAVIVWELERL